MTRTDSVLRTLQLTKSYGSRLAVDHLNLEVGHGEVFGFLGPNGAGKTTTIRMCLGLVRPTDGGVEIMGRELATHRREVLPRVGAMIESPALYDYLTGRDNLLVFGDALGGVSRQRIDEVLELVGLRGREGDRVRSYSLGMKQRLGLAVAMLHEPELLVLDEPANGLDPAGIVEMRDLLRFLAGEGRTIFVSSHVLAEVQQTCDRVAIINQGCLIKVAPVADLVGRSGEFVVHLADPTEALALVRIQPWGGTARVADGTLLTAAPNGRGRDLNSFLVTAGFAPDSVAERERGLEEIFLTLTNGGTR
jgi:ABC-2 type transport system ATP-binding protein